MLIPVKHRWVAFPEKEGHSGIIAWCNICGCTKWRSWEGFWTHKEKITYVTPWNHPNADKNTNVLSKEPKCVTVEVPENYTI